MADLTDAQVGETLDYLGQTQPAARARLTLPTESAGGGGAVAPPVTGGALPGTAGQPMGQQARPRDTSPLSRALTLAKSGVGAVSNLSDISREFIGPDATRGTIGGPGTPQTSERSLSDQLRSAAVQAGTPIAELPPATYEAIFGQAVSPEDFSMLASLAESGESIEGLLSGAGGAGIGSVLPFAGAAFDIASRAMGGRTSAERQAIEAALDVSAAALAGPTGGLSMVALPVVRTQLGDIFSVAEGTANPLQIASLAAGPAGIPLVLGETLASMFGINLGGLFGHQGSYAPKRQAAAAEAGTELSGMGAAMQEAATQFARSGNLADALPGLQTQFGARNPVRTDIMIPKDIAAQLGVSGPRDWGDRFQLSWSEISPQQFPGLLQYMASLPDQGASMILGSGDVGYLPQAQAQEVANSAKAQTMQYLQFLMGRLGTKGGLGVEAPTAPPAGTPSGPAGALGFEKPEAVIPTGPEGALGFAENVVGA